MKTPIKTFKEIWESRNPQHEINSNTGEDMFWKTAELVAKEYRNQSHPALTEDQIRELQNVIYKILSDLSVVNRGDDDYGGTEIEGIEKAIGKIMLVIYSLLSQEGKEERIGLTFFELHTILMDFALSYHKSTQKDIANDANEFLEDALRLLQQPKDATGRIGIGDSCISID